MRNTETTRRLYADLGVAAEIELELNTGEVTQRLRWDPALTADEREERRPELAARLAADKELLTLVRDRDPLQLLCMVLEHLADPTDAAAATRLQAVASRVRTAAADAKQRELDRQAAARAIEERPQEPTEQELQAELAQLRQQAAAIDNEIAAREAALTKRGGES